MSCEALGLSKEYYREKKRSQWHKSEMRMALFNHVAEGNNTAIEFGCGQGENLKILKDRGLECFGIDINPYEVDIARHRGLDVVAGDENKLNMFHDGVFDVAFTIGVLDHLNYSDFHVAIFHLTRVAKKAVYCLETNDVVGKHYYPHAYESLGFTSLGNYTSENGDKAVYTLWRYNVKS